ncbi:hypothetical protein HanXRQr2_Chr15g0682971 [Helianthus annuus]|uniref:Uncharacterized protein n=1 Tax=Helianthus annuus TaxID=4232 RepID=A0A9K3H2G4_HELAN|nr:hypothetical protein HanXRQr2_Chr15g0682971 [Helianthus annuus]
MRTLRIQIRKDLLALPITYDLQPVHFSTPENSELQTQRLPPKFHCSKANQHSSNAYSSYITP